MSDQNNLVPGQTQSVPFSTVISMVVGNVRSRLGRSAVTLFGVVLGAAFLMAAGTGDILRAHFAQEEADRLSAATAAVNVLSELGTLDGRTVAVWVEKPSRRTPWILENINKLGDVKLQIYSPNSVLSKTVGNSAGDLAGALAGADALIVCNDGVDDAAPLPAAVNGLPGEVVMDLSGVFDPEALAAQGLRYRHLFGAGALGELEGMPSVKLATGSGRRTWLIVISLLVSGIGIANALLMSVTERFREIGTLKCIGAQNKLVVQMFTIESALQGLFGSALGVVCGWLIALAASAFNIGWGVVWSNLPWPPVIQFAVICLCVGIVVAMVAAIYPAVVATRMVPALALRSEI